jgi:hypothetical protein
MASKKKTHSSSSQKPVDLLKHNLKSVIVLALVATFLVILIATMVAINNRQIASASRANIIDDSTQLLLDNLNLETECFTDANCDPGYVCRKPNPQSSVKRCLVCQQKQCQPPARTVKYGKLCLNSSCRESANGRSFYSSPTCEEGTFVSYDKEVIDNWCRSSDISLEFFVKLIPDTDRNIQFIQTAETATIMLTRYDTTTDQEVTTQTIEVPMTDLENPNPNRTYRFVSVLNAADIEQKRNAFKVWLQIPPYRNEAGNRVESPWISSPTPVTINGNTTQRSYEMILEY